MLDLEHYACDEIMSGLGWTEAINFSIKFGVIIWVTIPSKSLKNYPKVQQTV